MTYFLVLLFALLIGVVAGLRALTAPAVVAWAGALGWINLDATWAQWVAHPITVTVLTILALGELVTDQLPSTPSRRVPMQFGARLFTGAFSGAVLATGAVLNPTAWVIVGAIGAAMIGSVLGTLGGAEARKRLVAATGGRDLPVALVEDAIA
ncbi:MAG: DUF4126 family protein, partial [Mycobacterium sp.]